MLLFDSPFAWSSRMWLPVGPVDPSAGPSICANFVFGEELFESFDGAVPFELHRVSRANADLEIFDK